MFAVKLLRTAYSIFVRELNHNEVLCCLGSLLNHMDEMLFSYGAVFFGGGGIFPELLCNNKRGPNGLRHRGHRRGRGNVWLYRVNGQFKHR